MKALVYTVIIIGFVLITFFGLGPVVLADGAAGERVATLLAVLLLYVLLGWLTMRFAKRRSNKKR